MSKTAQRKRQAYQEGLQDGSVDRGYRWRRHPHMGHYRRGYHEGLARLKAKRQKKTWWFRAIRWICRKLGAS